MWVDEATEGDRTKGVCSVLNPLVCDAYSSLALGFSELAGEPGSDFPMRWEPVLARDKVQGRTRMSAPVKQTVSDDIT